jgi:hypothetical protein
MHWRAAKPPSSVIHAGRLSNLRASRFFGKGISCVFLPLVWNTLP